MQVISHKKPSPQRQASAWYRIYQPRPAATHRVILLPHAAGSASFFRQWARALPDHIEAVAVQYPGREERIGDNMIDTMEALVTQLAPQLSQVLDKPYVLFGHSMGGAIAYELYRQLEQLGLPLPEHLVISAIEGPSRHHTGNLHQQDDQALIQEMQRLDGTRVDLEAFPELADMILPLMRNDYRLIETYQPVQHKKPIKTAITVLTGDEDKELDVGDAEAWKQETTGSFAIKSFSGGHFYLVPQQDEVIATLTRLVGTPLLAHTPWPSMP